MYLTRAGQCTHHGGEQPTALEQHPWTARYLAVSFAQEMLPHEPPREISCHGPWKPLFLTCISMICGRRGSTKRWEEQWVASDCNFPPAAPRPQAAAAHLNPLILHKGKGVFSTFTVSSQYKLVKLSLPWSAPQLPSSLHQSHHYPAEQKRAQSEG